MKASYNFSPIQKLRLLRILIPYYYGILLKIKARHCPDFLLFDFCFINDYVTVKYARCELPFTVIKMVAGKL